MSALRRNVGAALLASSRRLSLDPGSPRGGGRCGRAKRYATGAWAPRVDEVSPPAGRFAFVTPAAMPAAPKEAGRADSWRLAESFALPPLKSGGAGRKNDLFMDAAGSPHLMGKAVIAEPAVCTQRAAVKTAAKD